MGATPEQIAQISLVSKVGGGISGAVGSYYQSAAQASSLKSQAEIAGINARIAELGAQSELAAGEKQVARQSLQAGQIKGAQRAAIAANGIDPGEGSAAEVRASSDIMAEMDLQTLRANTIRSAWGYRTQATNHHIDALTKQATAAGISPFGSVASSLLGSAGGVAASWYEYSKRIEDKGSAT